MESGRAAPGSVYDQTHAGGQDGQPDGFADPGHPGQHTAHRAHRTTAPGDIFKTPEDEWVDVNADVNDDNSISKVEFYAGDTLFATKTTAPFTVKWTIGKSGGTPNFKVVAYDAAGNRAESGTISVSVSAEPAAP